MVSATVGNIEDLVRCIKDANEEFKLGHDCRK